MSDKRDKEYKRFAVLGFLCLAGGSALLFAFKLPGLPNYLSVLCSIAGGVIVLFGNGCIFYGMLISAGNQEDE